MSQQDSAPTGSQTCVVLCCQQAEVEAVVSMCTADNIEQLLSGQPDFVLDAIDNIHTKVRGQRRK